MSEASPSRLDIWRARVDYQGVFLGAICAITTISLLMGNVHTIEPVAARAMEDKLVMLGQVLPAGSYDNNPFSDAITINDEKLASVDVYPARMNGALQSVAFQVSTIGYGGAIKMMVGVQHDGSILGVRVISHRETPGLADKIEATRSDWIKRFNGMSLSNTPQTDWAVKKDDGVIDQFTGATITPRAVVKGIHEALLFYARHAQALGGNITTREVKSS